MKQSDIKKLFKNDEALFFIAMAMFSKEKNTVLPELIFTLDQSDIFKLITIFGGETIYIPKPKELTFYLNCAIASYYYISQEYRWCKIQELMKLSTRDLNKIREKVKSWTKSCNKNELEILKKLKNSLGDIQAQL
ncbi:MAG: hypothetical protein HKO92_02215 [Flavobacteriaceae bacterium]|nr:hypothetical protein [Flavobacteriaceae bacterium]